MIIKQIGLANTNGRYSVTADGNKIFNNHKSGCKTLSHQFVNVLRPDL